MISGLVISGRRPGPSGRPQSTNLLSADALPYGLEVIGRVELGIEGPPRTLLDRQVHNAQLGCWQRKRDDQTDPHRDVPVNDSGSFWRKSLAQTSGVELGVDLGKLLVLLNRIVSSIRSGSVAMTFSREYGLPGILVSGNMGSREYGLPGILAGTKSLAKRWFIHQSLVTEMLPSDQPNLRSACVTFRINQSLTSVTKHESQQDQSIRPGRWIDLLLGATRRTQ